MMNTPVYVGEPRTRLRNRKGVRNPVAETVFGNFWRQRVCEGMGGISSEPEVSASTRKRKLGFRQHGVVAVQLQRDIVITGSVSALDRFWWENKFVRDIGVYAVSTLIPNMVTQCSMVLV
ncbi:hypothetical protein Hypma_003770 [Hypsizygus marmoreus]|uniref:Uncharacterized protein n=1 Tax=Hypsizygus marmoreus TaxID=39966 RepID=A0A369JZ01_HYPMA|nr:hypothetical protein Hypma_003770 [Hypsizygus marmoreus]